MIYLFLQGRLLWQRLLQSRLRARHVQRPVRQPDLQLHFLYPWPPATLIFAAASLSVISLLSAAAITSSASSNASSVQGENSDRAYICLIMPADVPLKKCNTLR